MTFTTIRRKRRLEGPPAKLTAVQIGALKLAREKGHAFADIPMRRRTGGAYSRCCDTLEDWGLLTAPPHSLTEAGNVRLDAILRAEAIKPVKIGHGRYRIGAYEIVQTDTRKWTVAVDRLDMRRSLTIDIFPTFAAAVAYTHIKHGYDLDGRASLV